MMKKSRPGNRKKIAKHRRSKHEIRNPFLLTKIRIKENEPTEIILADPDFHESLLNTISKIRSGAVKWHTYEEVFGEHPPHKIIVDKNAAK